MKTGTLSDDLVLNAIRLLLDNPEAQQRTLAKALGISLGNVNNCLRSLSDRGWIQMQVIPDRTGHRRYCYPLTPLGLEEKAKLTARVLEIKEAEYVALEAEIERLRAEVLQQGEQRAPSRLVAENRE
ncbi:MarR family EPS-associated transcriptional regulator [Thiocapsa marina]|uniref:Transcriptional regulator n=1 Tax=Thiocapsa marina 5811 TaxID=768671 RepID=F9U6D3_9GAMM|nr:MarR family EPS-associated transcriptional regulator [Thiocapsa marina]EGV20706.1 transcriptional regulator [Thiocapsa marina 5811]